jgi:hypothetical protein
MLVISFVAHQIDFALRKPFQHGCFDGMAGSGKLGHKFKSGIDPSPFADSLTIRLEFRSE